METIGELLKQNAELITLNKELTEAILLQNTAITKVLADMAQRNIDIVVNSYNGSNAECTQGANHNHNNNAPKEHAGNAPLNNYGTSILNK